MTTINIQETINNELTKFLNVHGRIEARNRIGYKVKLYGYIRKVEPGHVMFEHTDYPKQQFKLYNVISFELVEHKEIGEGK